MSNGGFQVTSWNASLGAPRSTITSSARCSNGKAECTARIASGAPFHAMATRDKPTPRAGWGGTTMHGRPTARISAARSVGDAQVRIGSRSSTSRSCQQAICTSATWNNPEIWRETSLEGGAFPAPDPAVIAVFENKYRAIYGEAPPGVASFGYDAGALVSALAGEDRLDAAMIQRAPGFGGVNGLYRFQPDGSADRALAVMQIQGRTGAKVVSPALQAFTPGS